MDIQTTSEFVLRGAAQQIVPKNQTWIPTYGCGCYDGDGYSFISSLQDVSPCVVNGIALNLLAVITIFYGLGDISRLRSKRNITARTPALFPVKLGLIALQIVFQIVTVFYTAQTARYIPEGVTIFNDAQWWSTVWSLVAMAVCFFLSYIENYKTYVSSTSLIVFWTGFSVIGVFREINLYLRNSPATAVFLTTATSLNSLFILIIEVNYSPQHTHKLADNFNPIDSANLFSRLAFTWLTPLMQKGYNKYLEQTDLPALPSPLKSSVLSSNLNEHWTAELNKNGGPSLFNAMVKSFGQPFAVAGLFKLIQDCIQFLQPQLLKQLILFVNDYSKDHSIPLTRGFMIVLFMFGLSIVQTAALHQYFQRVFDTGIKVKSSLNCLIYKKSLTLSPEAKQKRATGDIVNLMSVDTQRLQDLCQNLQVVWSGPFQLTLCLISLYKLIGNAMWVGVFILVITIPLNTVVFKKQRELQKKQMKVKDQRTGLISEMLNNIKSLKLYAWENPYKGKLTDVRNNKELKNLKKIGVFQAGNQFIFNSTPHMVSTATFALFLWWYPERPLSTEIMFTALALFNLLGFPLAVIPWVIGGLIEAQVSVKRLTGFLESDELDLHTVHRLPPSGKEGDACVAIENADFLWSRDPYKVALTNINYKAAKGTLNCIVGRVGAGKSSMLQALLGDLHKTKGIVVTRGSVAYVPQIPWIMNGTIRENILFGCKYEPDFYQKTLKACALTLDLEILPDGDQTQVGEKGISLSGGQKARLSLARAVYARADIYIMDDVLSAVDEHVGKHVIGNVLGPEGLLHSRCRILSTNNLHVLEYSDQITMLASGRVIESGSYDDLMGRGDESELYKLITEFGNKVDSSNSGSSSDDAEEGKPDEAVEQTVSSEGGSLELSGELDDEIKDASKKELVKAELEDFDESMRRKREAEIAAGRNEKHEYGKVSWDVYMSYFRACGFSHVLLMLLCIVLSMAFSVSANFWLKYWSDLNSRLGYNPSPWIHLATYFGLCISSTFFLLCESLAQWLLCSISGSKKLHEGMLQSVLRAPMEFFETTPIGRILNRFSNDIYKIDETLFRTFTSFFSTSVRVFFTILVIVFSTWQFVFFVLPLAFVYRYYQKYYLASSRELRRLDSVSRSPIFSHFEETLTGVATIRAYNQIKRFISLNQYNMDVNMSAYHPSVSANRWLAVRLEFLGSLVILGASGLLIVTLRGGHVTPGLVGLSVSYALQVTQSLNWIVRMTVDIESNIVSVERVLEYSQLKPEAPEIIEDARPPTQWPDSGAISFNNYSARYRPELDLVLKGISLSIQKKEKVGIAGRTGAGKSSLTLAIFRIIEAAGGNVAIDDVNTSLIGLFDLRSRLSIIPQDSQIFQGTIRSNLDPTDEYSDEELKKALQLSHLWDHVQSMYDEVADKSTVDNNPLLVQLSEGGSNLSVGQRQLMCLARALTKQDCKILVLDEATANVDVQTDSIVQDTIRNAFKERTILTIAHRLNTIIDSDKILVLDKGKVAEFDTPENLLKNKDSLFYSLCKEGGLISEE